MMKIALLYMLVTMLQLRKFKLKREIFVEFRQKKNSILKSKIESEEGSS